MAHTARDIFGLSFRFTPHSLRHGRASHDYEHGATVQDIDVGGRCHILQCAVGACFGGGFAPFGEGFSGELAENVIAAEFAGQLVAGVVRGS